MQKKQKNKSIISSLKTILKLDKKSDWYDSISDGAYQTYFWNTPGKPVWMPREYKKFADEAYIKNVIAHRCIAMISQGAANIPWKLFYLDGDKKTELKQHPVLKLLLRPNPCENGKELFESIYAFRMISGNAYVQAITPTDSHPTELYTLRPDRISLIAGNDGLPSAYQYTVGNTVQKFMVDKIGHRSPLLHLKNFHPLNDWYGLSAIEAAAYSIDQHNQSGMWNQALLQNGARPTGALVVKSGEGAAGALSDEQYNRIKNQMDEQFSGMANAGRPLLLEGGLEWREMSHSPKDMDFLNAKHSSARDIALAFGVPPQILGIPGDNTYSNLVEARVALWEQTIIPMVDNVTTALNNWLLPKFGSNLQLQYDADEVPALAPKRESLWNQINETNFMTLNEKRQSLGFSAIPGGDVIVK